MLIRVVELGGISWVILSFLDEFVCYYICNEGKGYF